MTEPAQKSTTYKQYDWTRGEYDLTRGAQILCFTAFFSWFFHHKFLDTSTLSKSLYKSQPLRALGV
jgi:hypothetical protein